MAATLKWSDERPASQELLPDGRSIWRAQISYQVTDAVDEADALAQCPLQMGSTHPVYGDEMRVNSIVPDRSGPNQYYTVHFIFSSDAPDAAGTINTKARIRWTRNVVTEEVDRDFDGHPITNSVGDPPTNTPMRDFYDLVLGYTRWEPSFNLRKSIKYVGAINDDNFSITFGTGPFNGSGGSGLNVFAGECLCTAMEPAGEYEEGQSLVQVLYEFRFRPRIFIAKGVWASGFDWRFMDQGSRGIYLDGADERLGEFYLRSDEPATEPVKLNGIGFPLRSTIGLTSAMLPPLGFTTPPAGASLDDRYFDSSPSAVFLIYKRHDRQSLKGLIPLFQ